MKQKIKIPFVAQFAKQKGIVATLCIVCTLFAFSCQSEEEVDDNFLVEMGVNGEQLPLLKLKGSKWKLEGIYISEAEAFSSPGKDNVDCYTLTFTINEVNDDGVKYDKAYAGGTKFCEPNHWLWLSASKVSCGREYILHDDTFRNLFFEWWVKIISYSISKTEMRLYTYESNNYFLYKRLKK